MTLSGNWRVSLLSASGVEVVPDVVELILDGKHTEYPIEGKKIKNAETGNEEVVRVTRPLHVVFHCCLGGLVIPDTHTPAARWSGCRS